MDSSLVTILVSCGAFVFSMFQFVANRLKKAQDDLTKAQLKRLHERLDDVHNGHAELLLEMNGKDGFYAKMAVLESKCKDL